MKRHNNGQALQSATKLIIADDSSDDEPFTHEDLIAIDAVFESATKKPHLSGDDLSLRRRRLPNSVLALQHPNSFSLSPRRAANPIMRYPVMKFGGKVLYSRTKVEVERAARELLETIEAKMSKSDEVAIGFDIEWKATFQKGAKPGKVAVMQICADADHCHVMHIIHSGIPNSLQSLLENSLFPKVGVGIGNDAIKIFKDYNVVIESTEELARLANRKCSGESQKWSLSSLIEKLVSKKLLKPNNIRLGNWEVDILSKEQLDYAATDAFASWYLYQVLRTLPDASYKIPDVDDMPTPNSSSLSPDLEASEKKGYPLLKFEGRIIYSRTTMEVDRDARELLEILEAKRSKSGQVAIGLDIEWKPSLEKGVKAGKAAVIQICADAKRCYVMHIVHSGIPKSLQSLLENFFLLKVGVGVCQDAVKIFSDYDIYVQGVEDLCYLADQKLTENSHKWGLAALTETLISKQLLKPKNIQLGDWEAYTLSQDQLEYAATDAFASWHLYEVLKTLPDIKKKTDKSLEVEVNRLKQVLDINDTPGSYIDGNKKKLEELLSKF